MTRATYGAARALGLLQTIEDFTYQGSIPEEDKDYLCRIIEARDAAIERAAKREAIREIYALGGTWESRLIALSEKYHDRYE